MTSGEGSGDAPHYLAAHAHDALAADTRLAALDLDVRVVGEHVYVSGTVNTTAQLGAANDVIARALPHHELHNELTVLEHREATASDTERLA